MKTISITFSMIFTTALLTNSSLAMAGWSDVLEECGGHTNYGLAADEPEDRGTQNREVSAQKTEQDNKNTPINFTFLDNNHKE